ncbi:hypothetical protein VPSG_00034 [Vibrio phage pYD38-B]|uniref:hypothetical protein n=1 Tax=Vibrio phage pYD38-B TaxID=929835 RepID=UPI00034263FD|nr:hypothetical protein VPSG_00034 [Vibrio phage pYD38-B]AGN34353.1 hypothetical protein VPSG_00034 [Vibrio phage pYD38-B]
MISKALLPTPLCAIEFKSTLDNWGVPSRMVINASGTPSRYVVFDGSALSPGQIKNLDATHAPLYVKIEITDIRFLEEINQ